MLKGKRFLFPMFLTAFIDMLGVGIVIPVLPAIFLNFKNSIFPNSFNLSQRSIVLGLLIAAYPLAQFIGAPILGAFSDRVGRKKVLMLSLIGTLIGYLIFGYGILIGNIWLLFVSRLLDGFTGGNISTIYSAIADVSNDDQKTHRFGYIGAAFGLGFILGPVVGGKLSDSTAIHWFNYTTPFIFAAILTFINIISVAWVFPETLKTPKETKLDPLVGFKNIFKASKIPNLKRMFLICFILAFGFNMFVQFFAIFLINKFKMTQSEVGNFFAYAGLWIAISQGVITKVVSKRFRPETVLKYSSILLSFSIVILLVPERYIYFLLLLPLVAIFEGLVQPNSIAVLSNMASHEDQGEVMGINQSLNSLSYVIPPILSGFIFAIGNFLPIAVAGLVTLLGWFLFSSHLRRNKLAVDNGY